MFPNKPAITTSVTVVESGVGKEIFKKLATALQTKNGDDKKVVLLAGVVQGSHTNTFIYKWSHVLLISGKPPEYPVVHDMDGPEFQSLFQCAVQIAVTLVSYNGCSQAVGFCPMSDSKLSKDQVNQLCNHISAYHTYGGGVIYIVRRTKAQMLLTWRVSSRKCRL